jgi:hypothetical protein
VGFFNAAKGQRNGNRVDKYAGTGAEVLIYYKMDDAGEQCCGLRAYICNRKKLTHGGIAYVN